MSDGQNRDHMEVEIKLALAGQADYDRVRAALGSAARTVEQINHYFETPDGRLRGAHAMLRVREGDGEPIATLKLRAQLTSGVMQAREVEAPVEPAVWAAVLRGERGLESVDVEPVRMALDHVGAGARLLPQGTMRNRRELHPLGGGFTAELDRTELPDGSVDFEVEVETPDPATAREHVARILDDCGAAWHEQSQSKYERFLHAVARRDTRRPPPQ